jgi:multidrug efflux system outer membrane protein
MSNSSGPTLGKMQPPSKFRSSDFGLWTLGLFIIAGCSVGPNYHRPSAFAGTNQIPAAFSEVGTNTAQWKTAEPAAHLSRGAWWQIFGDEELNRLENLATSGNQELAATVARFEQARALVNVARSDFFPHISAAPGYSRQRNSLHEHAINQTINQNFNAFSFALDTNWELDLWGRVRRQVEAARARLAAATNEIESVKLSIQAELAVDYFSLRALEAQYALLQRAIENFNRSLELTRNRRAGGIATDLDVAQAETQLRTTEALLPDAELQHSKFLHAIASLCGQPATGFKIESSKGALSDIPAIPLALPSELLERRPDIAVAEQRMAAANAEVGVAQSAFYPRVQFHGLAGFQSVNIGTLFDWPSRFWAVGPSLDLPLFTGGRNRAQLSAQRAAYAETVANYRQTILNSFQEVEDQLAAQRLLSAQLDSESAALVAAQRTLQIANNRYQAGLVTYLEVATAQSAELERERQVVRLKAERLTASATLAKALGGGWTQ